MSNFEHENPQAHADQYHSRLKEIQEREAERAEKLKAWENADGPKPTIDFLGGPLKTKKEMHQEAQDFADRKAEEQKKLEQVGLPQTPKKVVTFEEKLKAQMGQDKIERAKEQEREKQRREQERTQKHGDRGQGH